VQNNQTGGIGGGGGGANGNGNNSVTPPFATANTGGGGGGSGYVNGFISGSNGGSGIVIIRYSATASPPVSTLGNPQVSYAGGYQIYTWTSSGAITF
jgi:hypothetical protein